MKILWVSHFLLYPEVGHGALQRSRNLLLELSKNNDVYLLSYYRKSDVSATENIIDIAKNDLEKYCKKVVLFPFPNDKNITSKIITIIKSLFSYIPYSCKLYQSEEMDKYALDIIKKHNISMVHSDTMGITENIIKKLDSMGVKKILNHHNYESAMMYRRCSKEKNIIKKLLLYIEAIKLDKYEKRYCSKYNLNIFVSEEDKVLFEKNNNTSKTAVVTNGVDCKYYRHYYRDESNKGLIFTGQLDWYPNADAMLFFIKEVWPKLKNIEKNLTLTIIGKNAQPELLRLAEKEHGIVMKGYVPDLREDVKKARIFICPINDGGGTRLKILDAFAQGIPIVSSPIGCEGIDVKDAENILIAKSSEEYIQKIQMLLMDINLSNTLSKNGRTLVEHKYSFEVVGQYMNKIYQSLWNQ